jgi:hypothetical protein
MTYMRSWKSLRLTSYTWLGLNPQIGRPLSRIVVPLVHFIFYFTGNRELYERIRAEYWHLYNECYASYMNGIENAWVLQDHVSRDIFIMNYQVTGWTVWTPFALLGLFSNQSLMSLHILTLWLKNFQDV